MREFVHLHTHSSHSALDGLSNPAAWIEAAKAKGFSALALTDHASISGAVEFYKAAREAGITPILGVEFYCVDDPARKLKKGEQHGRYHLLVLAKTWKGLQSIFRALTAANKQFYYKPLLATEQIFGFEDCIISTGCFEGVLSKDDHGVLVQRLKATYGDDLYLEIMAHDFAGQEQVNRRAFKLHKEFGIKPVATNDCHYPYEEDAETQEVLLAVQTAAKWNDKGRFRFGTPGLFLRTFEEMVSAFRPWIEEKKIFPSSFLAQAFRSTIEIKEKCSGFVLPKLDYALPAIFENEEQKLLQLCAAGWEEKIKGKVKDTTPYLERLKHELKVMTGIPGVVRYLLMVYDLMDFAKKNDILSGFGRGSVGGSLVALLLGIINVDPVGNDLYFARFLRPDRIDMPDIDLDFGAADRKKVIEYIEEKYGAGNVCHISTATEMQGKMAFKDVARVFDIPPPEANKLSALINNELSIKENFEKEPTLKAFGDRHPHIVKHADRLNGQVRAKGMHAGGIIISHGGFESRGVIERRKDGETAVNWTMTECDQFGLLKIDILGLSNLSVLKETARLIKKRQGIDIDWHAIEPTDREVLKQFGDGHTAGFFQFESTGITRLCQELAPIQTFEELIHINALYRPGPLQSGMVDSYKKRKRGEEAVRYHHPKEEEITAQTFGLPIFQESIMVLCVKLAGFSWPEADNVRKVIAKSKGIEALEAFRTKFLEGCKETTPDLDLSVADRLFDQIVKFGKYSFNKAHAACYSYIAYLTAWAKYHYPAEFMAALLGSVTDESEQTEVYVIDCKRMGLKIELPDINLSEIGFSLTTKGALVAGLSSIKGVGEKAATAILEARRTPGSPLFSSVVDFMARTPRRTVNKKIVELLAFAGAFKDRTAKWVVENYPLLADGKPPLEVKGEYGREEIDTRRLQILPGLFNPCDMEREIKLDIYSDVLDDLVKGIRECKGCELHKYMSEGPVPFVYTDKSRIMLVGDLPGPQEEQYGLPLAGQARVKVETFFKEGLGFPFNRLLIANVFNCRACGGKLSDEFRKKFECARKWLDPLIKATKPEIIMVMGNTAMEFFTGRGKGITYQNGKTQWHPGYGALLLFTVSPGSMCMEERGEGNEELFKAALLKLKEYV